MHSQASKVTDNMYRGPKKPAPVFQTGGPSETAPSPKPMAQSYRPIQPSSNGLLGQLGKQWGKPLNFGNLPGVSQTGQNLPGAPGAPSRIGMGALPGQVQLGQAPGQVQLGQAPGQIGHVQGLQDPSQYQAMADQMEQATFDRGMARIQPYLARERRDLNTQLANRGLALGSEAWQDAENQFGEQRNNLFENLALSAVGAGRQEHSRLFGLDAMRRGQDLSQRSQDLAQRGQDLGHQALAYQGGLQQRGQDLGHQALGFQGGLQQRQQDLGYLGAQAELGLQQRGQDMGRQNFQSQLLRQDADRNFNQQMALRDQGRNELLLKRQQPFNELAQILSGTSRPTMPQFTPTPQYQIGAPNLAGMIYQNYGSQLGQYNQGMNRAWDFFGGLGRGYGILG